MPVNQRLSHLDASDDLISPVRGSDSPQIRAIPLSFGKIGAAANARNTKRVTAINCECRGKEKRANSGQSCALARYSVTRKTTGAYSKDELFGPAPSQRGGAGSSGPPSQRGGESSRSERKSDSRGNEGKASGRGLSDEGELFDGPLELEHVIGYTGAFGRTFLAMPGRREAYVKAMGSIVVIGDLQRGNDGTRDVRHYSVVNFERVGTCAVESRTIESSYVRARSFQNTTDRPLETTKVLLLEKKTKHKSVPSRRTRRRPQRPARAARLRFF